MASEGGIYERFGYGIATHRRVTSIDRRRAVLAERFRPAAGSVRLVDGPSSLAEIRAVWGRYRSTRAGEIDRNDAWHQTAFEREPKMVHALHPDGYASWTFDNRWNDGHPASQLFVTTMAPVTAEAHVALWHTVLSSDLVGTVKSYAVPPDDALPFLLTDQRQVRTTDVNDNVWCSVRDVATCFGARTFGTDDAVVVEVDGTGWRIGAEGVSRVTTRADLVTDGAGLGALLLGGVAPTTLVAGRRAEAPDAAALRRADATFVVHPAPYSQTGF